MNESLSTSWLGTRLGRDPQALDRLRRAGQILGVKRGGGYSFPAWQFDERGNVVTGMQQVIGAARAKGLSDERTGEILGMRVGMSERRVLDALREGNVDYVLDVVRAAAA